MQSLKNHFLIAMPMLDDPNFDESVTYICEHDTNGALGIVVNKPGDFTIGEICSQMNLTVVESSHSKRPVLAGGPVDPARGFVLHGSSRDFDSTIVIDDEIKLTMSRDIVEALADGSGPEDAQFALGYAGWAAGQLESELAANAWLSARASAEIIFSTPYEQRWAAAAKLIGVDIRVIANYAGRA